MFVKVCGITRVVDAVHAVRQGATAVGFVFWQGSPRAVSPELVAAITRELPPGTTTVGVFVNESTERIVDIVSRTGITLVQLHGEESPQDVGTLGGKILRSVTVDRADEVCAAWPADTLFVLDAADPVRRGGTGTAVDWTRAAAVARNRRMVLAGGLTPENVAEAIAIVHPFGVDVSSGVESAPGVKDLNKVTRFIASARSALEVLL